MELYFQTNKSNDKGSQDADAIMKLDVTLSGFKLMKIEALKDFLSLRNKSTDGDFETQVSRCILCLL